jgi:hypothetical protein
LREHRCDRCRESFAEQRRQFRRCHKISGETEFARAGNVVAEPRRVEGRAHVIGEGNPTAGRRDHSLDMRDDASAVRQRFMRWYW